MKIEAIKYSPVNNNKNGIHYPVQELTEEMYAVADDIAAARWVEQVKGGKRKRADEIENLLTQATENGTLDQIADIKAYFIPRIYQHNGKPTVCALCRIEITFASGKTASRNVVIDAEPDQVLAILESYFATGAPSLYPSIREFYKNLLTQYRKLENAA